MADIYIKGRKATELYTGTQRVYAVDTPYFPAKVKFGEHDYPVIRIGGLLWMARDLYEDVGSNIWFNNDPTYEQKGCGRIYQWYNSKNDLSSLLHDGWMIPTSWEYQYSMKIVGTERKKWMKDGTNESKWDGVVSGTTNTNGSLATGYLIYWANETATSTTNYNFYVGSSAQSSVSVLDGNSTSSSQTRFQVRFCKYIE